MIIEIFKLEEPLHLRHELGVGELDFKTINAHLAELVHLDALITKEKDNMVSIKGHLDTSIYLTCSRCLRNFRNRLDQDLDLFYQPSNLTRKGEEMEIHYEDMNVAYYNGLTLDIDAIVLEQLELSVPMKPLCSEHCKGLCEICGADLNLEVCKCSRAPIDERLTPLLDVKKKMKP